MYIQEHLDCYSYHWLFDLPPKGTDSNIPNITKLLQIYN
jgi:hypothetical protein